MEREAQERLVAEIISDHKSNRRWTLIRRIGISLVFLFGVVPMVITVCSKSSFSMNFGKKNIPVVLIKGTIEDGSMASAQNIIPAVRKAFQADGTTVILSIDSRGGSPLEAERIWHELERQKAATHKKSIAVIGTYGTSAAYMIAAHCDEIYSSDYSMVGSIGVKMDQYNVSDLAGKIGVSVITYASADKKDFLDPFRAVNEMDRQKGLELVKESAAIFIADVQQQRKQKLASQDLFTGEAWTGSQAKSLGLVDHLGTLEDVTTGFNASPSYYGPAAPSPFTASSDFMDGFAASIAKHLLASMNSGALQM